MNTVYRYQNRTEQGVSLIEILVTVLILATGLLGMATLQTRSLTFSNIAYLNTQASIIGYDMLDRIKANPVFAIDGPGYTAALGNMPGSYPNNCETSDCAPNEVFIYDRDQWKFNINEQLPDGDGTIAINDVPEGREYIITIFFDDSKGQAPRRQIIIRSTL